MAKKQNRVGVRQLRQNLSVYLRRVVAGEVLEVTDRGRGVAVLAPLPQEANALERLVAQGKAIPASHDLCDLGAPMPIRLRKSLSRSLREDREERL